MPDLTPERRITLRQTAGHYQHPHALSTERYLADCLDEALDALDAKDREIGRLNAMVERLVAGLNEHRGLREQSDFNRG